MANVKTQYVEATASPITIRLNDTAAEVHMVLAGTGTLAAGGRGHPHHRYVGNPQLLIGSQKPPTTGPAP